MAKIYISDYDSSSVSMYLGDLDTDYSKNDRVVTWYIEGGDDTGRSKSTDIPAGADVSKTTKFRGMYSDMRYKIWAVVTSDSGSWDFGPVYITTLSEEPVIDITPWSWSASNGNATTAQTKRAYSVITTQGVLSGFNYLVWNDIVDKLDAVLSATSNTWDSTYASKEDTKMSSEDKKMTAVRFNSVRNNIRMRYSVSESSYPLAVKGDPIKGSYFVTITDSINGWIGTI